MIYCLTSLKLTLLALHLLIFEKIWIWIFTDWNKCSFIKVLILDILLDTFQCRISRLNLKRKSGFIIVNNCQSLDQGLSSAAVVLVYSVEYSEEWLWMKLNLRRDECWCRCRSGNLNRESWAAGQSSGVRNNVVRGWPTTPAVKQTFIGSEKNPIGSESAIIRCLHNPRKGEIVTKIIRERWRKKNERGMRRYKWQKEAKQSKLNYGYEWPGNSFSCFRFTSQIF